MELSLPPVRLAHYRFALRLDEAMRLPRYAGPALRGGFGYTLRRMVCLQRARTACDGCLLGHTCAYAYLFDPGPLPDAEVLRGNSDVPLGFVLEPPLETQGETLPGAALAFGLTLVGRAVDYLPYFVMAFRELGRHGLGRARARYTLAEVTGAHPVDGRTGAVYAAADDVLRDCHLEATWAALEARAAALPTDRLTVEFITPARLKYDGHYHQAPEFHVLVRALLRRASSLAYFHGGARWEIDYRGWIERAKAVRTAEARTGWMEWERYSTRQKQRTSLGGAVGFMTYEGELAPFRPLLALGEWIHAGKGTVFGNGMMRVR